jgi:hypothetical protein
MKIAGSKSDSFPLKKKESHGIPSIVFPRPKRYSPGPSKNALTFVGRSNGSLEDRALMAFMRAIDVDRNASS